MEMLHCFFDFCLLHNMRRYSVNLRERDYPTFEGRYNAYISVYGQLSDKYLGDIEYPIAMDVTPDDIPFILNTINLPEFIAGQTVSKW